MDQNLKFIIEILEQKKHDKQVIVNSLKTSVSNLTQIYDDCEMKLDLPRLEWLKDKIRESTEMIQKIDDSIAEIRKIQRDEQDQKHIDRFLTPNTQPAPEEKTKIKLI
jgi:hypothetical protein